MVVELVSHLQHVVAHVVDEVVFFPQVDFIDVVEGLLREAVFEAVFVVERNWGVDLLQAVALGC